MKGFKAWKKVRPELERTREVSRLAAIEDYLRNNQQLQYGKYGFEAKATMIQKMYKLKIQQKNKGKAIREELKKLPLPVRPSYIKMMILKQDSQSLAKEKDELFGTMNKI